MPATAAIDNETLDHLLSVTDLALAALGKPAIATFSTDCDGNGCRVAAGRGHAGHEFFPEKAAAGTQYSILPAIRISATSGRGRLCLAGAFVH